ncbi:MAG: hypothetical protein ACRC9P_03375 [Bacteroides sp.]
MSNKVKLSDLDVTVTYRVGLGNVEVSDKVLRGLEKMQVPNHDAYDNEVIEAEGWLSSNISEYSACELDYQINNVESEVGND